MISQSKSIRVMVLTTAAICQFTSSRLSAEVSRGPNGVLSPLRLASFE